VANTLTKARLYPPSAIGEILKIARERARQEEQRTKRYMTEELGITADRLTKIENGTAQVPFELAVQWCQILGDYTALNKIKHIYGMALPPADPWLLESVADQLNNFIRQAKGAIEAAECLLDMSSQRRRRSTFSEHDKQRILELSEEILDVQQSSECVISSLKINWDLDTDALFKNWIQEALADQVIISSVTEFDNIRKEQYFEDRLERIKH